MAKKGEGLQTAPTTTGDDDDEILTASCVICMNLLHFEVDENGSIIAAEN